MYAQSTLVLHMKQNDRILNGLKFFPKMQRVNIQM